MHRLLYIFLLLPLPLQLQAQDSVIPAEEVQLPTAPVQIELQDATLFTDQVATAVIYFDSEVEVPEPSLSDSPDIHLLEINLQATPNSLKGQYAAVIRFLPRKVGSLIFPALSFTSTKQVYQTQALIISVSQPVESDQMSLTIEPQKQRVYVGEALRMDLTWQSELNPAELQSLQLYPAFFNDSQIEIVIPRNTAPERQQIGLPIGGRRVIATRLLIEGRKALGQVKLPIYLRFTKPGTYTLPATRMECAHINDTEHGFARYAAHFNNAFFEPVDRDKRYQRIYTTAPEIEIEVLPLPANETGEAFSGLFTPVEIELTVTPDEVEIGHLMQLELKLTSHSPHGMLDLPALSDQSGLRGRFLIDNEMSRLWHAEGSLFRTRLRALSTSIRAFPALHFLALDPETGRYIKQSTAPIPLKTLPSMGQNYIPLNTFQGAAIPLTQQPTGIWHNLKANPMNDILNALLDFLNRNFWLGLALGPALLLALLPLVRERRRRAKDPKHLLRAEAYKQFKRLAADAPEKWPAFLEFMATHFDSSGSAWTLSDSQQALQSIHAEPEVIQQVTAWHNAVDTRDFSAANAPVEFTHINSIAIRVRKGISQGALLLFALCAFVTTPTEASDWSDAEQNFAQAQAESAGSAAAQALYAQAALKFQSAANAANHSGEAWLNAGNAWFEAGSIGRSIAAYRSAQTYRPFDAKLSENLAAVRALRLNAIADETSVWQQVPTRWLRALVVLCHLIFWLSLLIVLRYRKRWQIALASALGLIAVLSSGLLWQRTISNPQTGVTIVDTLEAKKGPNFAYANAFNESLHDGAEFIILENRDNWIFVELTDGRRCWLPSSQVTTIEW